MNSDNDKIQPAVIRWDESGQPICQLFDDVYFSRDGGCRETRYVFLKQNHLAERWQALEKNTFTIGETGFGTGLNFLSAEDLWLQVAPQGRQLRYVAVEKHPLGIEDLKRAHLIWPQFAGLTKELVNAYPALMPGVHRLLLAEGRIELTLLFGDATSEFRNLAKSDFEPVDAWFLDGFAPAKNPGMWTEDLFAALAALSIQGTTFSTFTAAGNVRRGLTRVGFRVEKIPGYGSKRHMLRGLFAQSSTV